MMLKFDLPTPAVVIDYDIAERNILRTARLASAHGKKLRPHIKTHKMVRLAQLQMNFAVEVVPEAVVRTEVNHRVNRVSGGTQVVTTVQTGDTAPLMIWSAVALGCGVILFVVGMAAWKRNREKGE